MLSPARARAPDETADARARARVVVFVCVCVHTRAHAHTRLRGVELTAVELGHAAHLINTIIVHVAMVSLTVVSTAMPRT